MQFAFSKTPPQFAKRRHYLRQRRMDVLANQMFWDICSKRPNVLGQDLIKEDNRAKKCFDKSETESEIIV